MADFPFFVALDTSWRPGLVIAQAEPVGSGSLATGPISSVVAQWAPGTSDGKVGIFIHALPGLSPSTKYRLTLLVFPI